MRTTCCVWPGLVTLAAFAILSGGCSPKTEGQPSVAPSAHGSQPSKGSSLEILPIAEVRPGMKGYGLSVFSGTKIEKFDVEVVSVLRKYFGDKDVILVRVGHPVTDHANIIAGMSGSPIYLDGRLAGALSLGFASFQKDPLAGITPIEYMLADREHPWEEEKLSWTPLPKDAPFQYFRPPLFVSGLAPAGWKGLRELFEPLGFDVRAGAAGSDGSAEEVTLEPGAAVGVSLLRGDIEINGIGTVSYVNGNDVLVFGHMMGLWGQIEIPMTTAHVHTVIASQEWSYKLASAGKVVGCFTKDRLTSVYGELGKIARMAPLTVEVENQKTGYQKTFHFEVAQHPLYTPALISRIPEFCLLLAEPGEQRDQTIRFDLHLKFEGFPELEMSDAYVSSPMEFFRRSGYQETIFELMGNPFRRVRLEEARMKLAVTQRRSSAVVDAAWPKTRKIKPGDKLELTVRLRPYNQEPFTETIEVSIPSSLPDGDYQISVMSGSEARRGLDPQDLMQALFSGRLPSQSEAQSFEELVHEIKKRHPANRLLARLQLPSVGVRYKDRELENLPASAFVTLAFNPSAGMRFERNELEAFKDTDWVIEGRKSVKFEVRTPGRPESQEEEK